MVSFNLVRALNNVGEGGLAKFGAWKIGYFQSHDWTTFTIFDRYGYVGGGAYVPGDPFSNTNELAWQDSTNNSGYPHLGIENINGHSEIRPNIWNESIYIHPGRTGFTEQYYLGPEARSAVIRYTAPYDGELVDVTGRFVKGSETFNVQAGFTIMKNGVPVIPRVVANQGEILPINTPTIQVMAGDFVDFVVDMAEDGLTSDDSAITLNIDLQLSETPAPVLTGTPDCTATSLSGTVQLVQDGTVVVRTTSGTILGTGTISPIVNTINGSWTITGLNIQQYAGQTLELVATETGNVASTAVPFTVGTNPACITCVAPVITTQPATTTTICAGGNATLSVTATGTPLNYTWFKDNVAIAGQTASTLSVTAVGTYRVEITNLCGTAVSTPASIVVNQPPTGGGVQSGDTVAWGTAFSSSTTYAGLTPFTISSIVKPAWLSIVLVGSTVTLSGTPAIGDVATSAYSYTITNTCGSQNTSGTITVTAITADAVDDNLGNRLINVLVSFNLSTNDVACSSGTTTYALVAGSEINVTVDSVDSAGLATFTPTTAGAFSFRYNILCNGQVIDTATVSGIVVLPTADAVDDDEGQKAIGVPVVKTIHTNDIQCSSGTTTFSLVPGSSVNVTVNSFSTSGSANYTPLTVGAFSFRYNIICGGIVIDTATVSGTGFDPCVPISGGNIDGLANVTQYADSTYTVSGLIGTGPYTYLWTVGRGSIISGQGTQTIVVTPTDNPLALQCVVTNCNGTSSVTLSKNVYVKVGCNLTVPVTFRCYSPATITGTLQGINETNRVTGFNIGSISFRADVGLRNYEFTIIDIFGVTHKMVVKNVTC